MNAQGIYRLCLLVLITIITFNSECDCSRSFTIESEGNQFLKDGQPFRYVSGTLHYFKVPSVLWRDRMMKYKMAGLNAIQTYVEWNSHEPEEGVFDFEGDNDLIKYLQTANELGLYVILRTGPFIDAERDLGGLPYWLLSKNASMQLRTSDPSYLNEVDKWFSLLLPMLRPMLYQNGGPILMTQVENEYGSYFACDYEYVTHLRDLHHKYLGEDVLLFTTDGNGDYFLKCGKIDNVFSTIDFGPGSDPYSSFKSQRVHQQYGPNVNSEYYTGWIDHWEQPHSTATSSSVCETLDVMLSLNASVNLYPLHGGTSFGFGAGANMDGTRYDPCTTSYDFDAPLTEAGDPTQKYFDVRKIIGKYLPLPNGTLPSPSPKMELPPIEMAAIVDIFDITSGQTPINSSLPMTFEQLRLRNGFILYSTNITFRPSDPAVLTVNGLADRAQVFVDGRYSGTLSRTQNLFTIGLDIEMGSRLDLLVENQGRICYGSQINEPKGITKNITLGPYYLRNWNHYLLFKNWSEEIEIIGKHSNEVINSLTIRVEKKRDRIPTFFASDFVLPNRIDLPLDTFLRLDGWRKGLAFLNGFNLGHYWTVGPQITLYTPKHLFNAFPKINKLVVFELESFPSNKSVQFVAKGVVNGTTPYTFNDQDKQIKPKLKAYKFEKRTVEVRT